jgi:hypothetical protein
VFLKTSVCDVQRISVYGVQYGFPEDLLLESGIEEGINIFSDMSAFEASLGDHPLVSEVWIERRPPRALFIRVEEREPFVYLNGIEPILVARDGTILSRDRIAIELDLPLLTLDNENNEDGGSLLTGLRFLSNIKAHSPALYTHVSELVMRDGRPAFLYLRTPRVRVLLGDSFTLASTNLLVGVLSTLEKSEDFFEVDLRFKGQAVVRSFGVDVSPTLYKAI